MLMCLCKTKQNKTLIFTEPPQHVWICASFGGGHLEDVTTY